MNRPDIRRAMRRRRRALSARQQQQAAMGLEQHLGRGREFRRARRVALYLANDGEINPMPTIQALWKRGVGVYLPVLHPLYKGKLVFVRFDRDSAMQPNRYGIAEPVYQHRRVIMTRFLDVIALPLVAFDEQGQRLGMGGGYYDRTLAFTRRAGKRPCLIGCAHECQKFDSLPTADWDIPLDAIATDQRYLRI